MNILSMPSHNRDVVSSARPYEVLEFKEIRNCFVIPKVLH